MPLDKLCSNAGKILVTLNPNGPLEGQPVVSVLSGDGSLDQSSPQPDGTPLTGLQFWAVSGAAGGSVTAPLRTVFHVAGDPKQGPGGEVGSGAELQDIFNLDVFQAEPSTLGLSAGEEVPK